MVPSSILNSFLFGVPFMISDVEKTTSTLKPFFHNRVSEFHEIIAMMEKYCPFEDLQHVSRISTLQILLQGGLPRKEILD